MAVYGIKWVKRRGGGVPEVLILPEGSSQTFKEGQPLVYDTSLEGVKLASVGTIAFKGIALADASGTNLADMPVLIPTSADVFTATIADTGVNVAGTHDNKVVDLLMGWLASTESGQTAKITLDFDNLTNHWVKIDSVYVDANEPINTAGGRCYFSFLQAAIDSETVS